LAEIPAPVQSVKALKSRYFPDKAESIREIRFSNPACAWPLMTKVGVALTLYLATPSSPTLLMASSSSLRASQVASLAVSNGVAVARVLDRDVPYTTQMPLVDQHEYGFIEVDDTGAVSTIQRKTVLTGSPGPLDGMFR